MDYVAAKENLGPAGGIALGMEQVLSRADDDDWIVLLDDDDPPPRVRSLEELKEMGDELLARDPRIAGIGLATARFDRRSGRLLLVSEAERASGTPIRGDYIGGNRLPIYRVAAIRDVGVFDPKLFFGFEELDFGLRLRRAGYSLYEYRSPGHREWAESAARAAEGPRWGRSPGFGMPSARVTGADVA